MASLAVTRPLRMELEPESMELVSFNGRRSAWEWETSEAATRQKAAALYFPAGNERTIFSRVSVGSEMEQRKDKSDQQHSARLLGSPQ